MKTIEIKNVLPEITSFRFYLDGEIPVLLAMALNEIEDDMFPFDDKLIYYIEKLTTFWNIIGTKDYTNRINRFLSFVEEEQRSVKMTNEIKSDIINCCEDYIAIMTELRGSHCANMCSNAKKANGKTVWMLTGMLTWLEELKQAKKDEE